MVNVPPHISRMIVHPDADKVLATASPDGKPHAILCASTAFIGLEDADRIAIGESGMSKTAENLSENPYAELLVSQGKDAYCIELKAADHYVSGSISDVLKAKLQKVNIDITGVWEFEVTGITDVGLSGRGGQRVI